jgi:threonine dehydratase
MPDRGAEDGVGDLDGPGAMEYLTAVLMSKVYDVAIECPLQDATKLSKRLGVNFLVKREDKQVLPPEGGGASVLLVSDSCSSGDGWQA